MISVCLTTYNGEKYILEQLQSILSQLSMEDEVVVSDDGSTDLTIEIMQRLKDDRIKIFLNNEKGICSNIENALNKTKGDIIFLADQDDVWLPEKVGVCTKALSDYDLVVSDCFVVDKDLKTVKDSFFLHNNSQSNKWKALFRNPYLGCCMAFKRTVMLKSLPFPRYIPMHDIWIGNVAAFNFKVGFLPEKLIYYRRHGSNASTASEQSKAKIMRQIKYRTSIIQGLIKLSLHLE